MRILFEIPETRSKRRRNYLVKIINKLQNRIFNVLDMNIEAILWYIMKLYYPKLMACAQKVEKYQGVPLNR